MSSNPWPELESTTTTKTPEWSLRTESELHIERLEAKLDGIKKKHARPSRQQHRHAEIQGQTHGQLDLEAEEIQSGQEEADEGLWLLWNNKTSSPSTSDFHSGTPISGESRRNLTSYGSNHGQRLSDASGSENEEDQEEREEREERLEVAKARAKHVEEYVSKDRACSRTCCCIIS